MSDRKCELPAIKLEVMMNNSKIIVELDTRESDTLINESTLHQIWPKQKPDVSKADLLRTYTGEMVPLLGTLKTTIKYKDQTSTLPVLIVKGQGPNIIGRDSTTALKMKWSSVHQVLRVWIWRLCWGNIMKCSRMNSNVLLMWKQSSRFMTLSSQAF